MATQRKDAKPLFFPDSRGPAARIDMETLRNNRPGYIPGYDEIVKANEIAASDDFKFLEAHRNAPSGGIRTKEDAYRVIGASPKKLDVEFGWERVSGVAGGRSHAADVQIAVARAEGWVPATFEELEKRGFGMPPNAHVDAEGLIRRKDVALHMRSSEDGDEARALRRRDAKEADSPRIPGMFAAGGAVAPAIREETVDGSIER